VKDYSRADQADAFLPKGMCSSLDLLERLKTILARKRGPKKPCATALAVQQLAADRRIA